MADEDALATAIAARFAPGLVTPPAGYVNVRRSTADLPNAITAVPVVLVFPQRGTLRSGTGTRLGLSQYAVRFYFGRARDLPRQLNACRKWLTVLKDQLRGAVQLGGLAGVDRCTVDGWSIGTLLYGDREYVGIELTVNVATSEGWSATS